MSRVNVIRCDQCRAIVPPEQTGVVSVDGENQSAHDNDGHDLSVILVLAGDYCNVRCLQGRLRSLAEDVSTLLYAPDIAKEATP